ncbi:hypothetical protein FACS189483_09370 [Spirochaetia bacterium]|nr:hypothetical protein FACS189483_09370 [Spirochaetia bacterium]
MADITLYAQWINSYTVSYNENGADGTPPAAQTAISGISVTIAGQDSLTSSGGTFTGWNTQANGLGTAHAAGSTLIPTGNITLYAQWEFSFNVSNAGTFSQAINAINSKAVNGTYTITITENFAYTAVTFTTNAIKTIGIKGDADNHTISNNGNTVLFTIPKNITLILDANLTLNGNAKSYSVVQISSGGGLKMNAGSTITGAGASGVFVNGGSFAMSGGTISGNTSSSYAGGVSVSGGVFTMSGGTISSNTVSSYYYGGGGVFVNGGAFTMSGGTISGNTSSYYSSYGGGVSVTGSGIFTKTSAGTGTISNTNSAANGKVAYVSSSPVKKRETTAGPGVYMDSHVTGSAGGWE